MFPNMDGLIYLMTIPLGVAIGLLGSLALSLAIGPTWWLIAPPVLGFYAGIQGGHFLIR